MKVGLTLLDRMMILNMLPKQGNLINARASQNTANLLMVTKEETETFEVKSENGMTTWNEEGKKDKEFELPPSSVKLIRDTLMKLDAEEKLSVQMVSVFEKFFPEEKETPA